MTRRLVSRTSCWPPPWYHRPIERRWPVAPISLGEGAAACISVFLIVIGLLVLLILLLIPLGLLGFGRLALMAVFTWLVGSGLLLFLFLLVVFFIAQAVVGLAGARPAAAAPAHPAGDERPLPAAARGRAGGGDRHLAALYRRPAQLCRHSARPGRARPRRPPPRPAPSDRATTSRAGVAADWVTTYWVAS